MGRKKPHGKKINKKGTKSTASKNDSPKPIENPKSDREGRENIDKNDTVEIQGDRSLNGQNQESKQTKQDILKPEIIPSEENNSNKTTKNKKRRKKKQNKIEKNESQQEVKDEPFVQKVSDEIKQDSESKILEEQQKYIMIETGGKSQITKNNNTDVEYNSTLIQIYPEMQNNIDIAKFALNPNAATFEPRINSISGFNIPQYKNNLSDTTQVYIPTSVATDKNAESRLHLERLKRKSNKQMQRNISMNSMKRTMENKAGSSKKQLKYLNKDEKNSGPNSFSTDRNRQRDRSVQSSKTVRNIRNNRKGINYNRDNRSCEKQYKRDTSRENDQDCGYSRNNRNDKNRGTSRIRGNANEKFRHQGGGNIQLNHNECDGNKGKPNYRKLPEQESRPKNKNVQKEKSNSEFKNRNRPFKDSNIRKAVIKRGESYSETSKPNNREKIKELEKEKEKLLFNEFIKKNTNPGFNSSYDRRSTSTVKNDSSRCRERHNNRYERSISQQQDNWRVKKSPFKSIEGNNNRTWNQNPRFTSTSPKRLHLGYTHNNSECIQENWRQKRNTAVVGVKCQQDGRNLIDSTPSTSKALLSLENIENTNDKLNNSQKSTGDISDNFINNVKSNSSFTKNVRQSISLLDTTLDKELQETDEAYDEFIKTYKDINEYKIVREVCADIFNQPLYYSLAHCVAEDFRMASGIAIDFKRNFKGIPELLNQRGKQGGLATLEDKKNDRFIYYLITKRESLGKPCYGSLWKSLCKLRSHLRENLVEKLAIPRLGCGLDRLDWNVVKPMLEFIFRDADLDILVCNMDRSEDTEPTRRRSFNCPIVTEDIPITEIDSGTAIFYFSTQNSYCDKVMEKLAVKFDFMKHFNRESTKRLGQLIYYEDPTKLYLLCGCIVRKSEKDKLNFMSFSKCLQEFNRINKKYGNDAYQYVAFQQVEGESEFFDDLINQKILTMMINQLKGVSVHFCKGEL